jgi:hypothetical protein
MLGRCHRLKLIKRQMYGRAKLDLLRIRHWKQGNDMRFAYRITRLVPPGSTTPNIEVAECC